MAAKKKKLYRSSRKKIISGIFGGLDEYFGVDATVLRLGYLLVVIFTGFIPGLVAYLVAIFIVPKK